jgi:opacity protein-like surface antigen
MKRSVIAASLAASAFAFALAAQAQTAAPKKHSMAKVAPKEHSMTGCLKAGTEANSYMLTDVEGNGPKSVGIVSSTANLAAHVSHKIEITGTTVSVKKAESLKPAPPKAPHYMKLTAIKMLSTTCP